MNTLESRTTKKTALVIGATGGIGGAVAEALLAHGWQVRALTRRSDTANTPAGRLAGIEWRQGDAMNAADVMQAAKGVDCIFHGANPPKYQRWRELALPMLENSIAAARANGARLIFPGCLYNYGPDAWPLVSESSPQNPLTRKGQIRVEMEQLLQHAGADGTRIIIIRAGDFFGAHGPSAWFSTLLVKAGKPLRSIFFPGGGDIGHAWAYLPDLAETIARLAAIESTLPACESYHFGGHWLERGHLMADAIRRAADNPKLPIRQVPWLLLQIISPFVSVLREMLEMRYLWQEPIRLDNRKLISVLGAEPHTELDVAVKTSLIELGCLPPAAQSFTAIPAKR